MENWTKLANSKALRLFCLVNVPNFLFLCSTFHIISIEYVMSSIESMITSISTCTSVSSPITVVCALSGSFAALVAIKTSASSRAFVT